MKAIIPVKDCSTRVPNKNFKDFYNGHSLFDITVQKLLKSIAPTDIYMSCENASRKLLADQWGINFITRDPILADNDTPFYDVFNGICDQIPGEDDIAWCQVIDPMFDSYQECFDIWNNGYEILEAGAYCRKRVQDEHDSLVVAYPHKDYFLNSSHQPEGFGFGRWHKKSQLLPIKYQLTFTLSILTRESIKSCGYFVGAKPYWYHANNKHVDIDTEADFTLAQHVYAHMRNTE